MDLPRGVVDRTVFESLFFAYPDALLVVDLDGTIVIANPAAAAMLGYGRAELEGHSVDMLVPDAIRPRHSAYRQAYAEAPRVRPMGNRTDLVARRKDGSEVVVEIALSPLSEHGIPFVVAAIRDVSTYPRVRQALQRARYSEHLAQVGRIAVDSPEPNKLMQEVSAIAAAALEVDSAAVYLLETDGQYVRVAAGVGLAAGEPLGARIPFEPDSSPGLVLSRGIPLSVQDYHTESRFEPASAYIDAGLRSALAVPLSDRGRTIGALAVRSRRPGRFGDDELRFAESLAALLATSLQRSRSEEALNHAQRLESVGQLTGGIAHDFNNLLTVMLGNLQVLQDLPALAGDETIMQMIDAAERAGRRGAELTGKLLAFSRRQVLQPAAVDLVALTQSLTSMLRRTVDQRIRFSVQVPDHPAEVFADPGQLESALLNIAINARDAMLPSGGTLTFTVRADAPLPEALRDDAPSTDGPRDGPYGAIAVSDTGTGMTQEVKERAFEPFFTTKEAGRGTGLGLSTVYGFVRQSQGEIAIDSAPGAGTTVTLYLPQPEDRASVARNHLARLGGLPPGLSVLLVEDDVEVLTVVRNFLRALACDVVAASSGEEALGALAAGRSFELLLTDVALGPGLRGTQLAAQVAARLPGIAVLLMSGYSSELLDADRDVPASWELLRKPYSRDDLAAAIARVLAAKRVTAS